ncbi:aldo/keto reductase [Enterovirga rhinocerotis]|uniref:Aryl-alcohol dehydrogenase-like predicted oxidoreductase n=1 Tax=Enterovirga rhinocerotis TaxID=1339210 RepID=A0A4R7C7P4_9HYPH|nr:aldo/keto reductase [Enterovirga rhinocerotis]TDR94660.1 aryl-alcohol dehydrogenase-like predicted oxidoreductase [Enterovirga rhinocerotis]
MTGTMIGLDRRGFLGAVGGATVTLAASGAAQAQTGGTQAAGATTAAMGATMGGAPITRQIPRTGQSLTALGLGTFLTFDLLPGASRQQIQDVFRLYVAGGGRVVDTSPLYGSAEASVGAFLSQAPADAQMFLANKIWATGEYLGDVGPATDSLEQSKLRTWRSPIDLMQCHSIVNAPVVIPLLQAWKKEGQIRLVGVTHHETAAHEQLAQIVGKGDVDMVQVNYSIFDRHAEQRLLPLAADRGVGVLVNLPLEKARLMKVVEGHRLPGFASEFGATSWAQFFLKWAMAHPAVTSVLCGTSDPDHVVDNLMAMHGPLPDAAMRRRMVAHMETIPGFGTIASMPWYPGKDRQYQGLIKTAQARARARLSQ